MENLVIRKLRGAFAAKQSRGQFWKSVPDSSVGLFCVAVFTLFATLGFLTLMMRTSKLPLAETVFTVLLTGGCAVLYAIVAIRRKYIFMPLIFVLQGGGFALLGQAFAHDVPLVSAGSEMSLQLRVLGWGGVVMLTSGYVFFLLFFSREGERFFRTHTEITLARELHQALVPEIQ
jgi:hypothetical protein